MEIKVSNFPLTSDMLELDIFCTRFILQITRRVEPTMREGGKIQILNPTWWRWGAFKNYASFYGKKITKKHKIVLIFKKD